MEFRILGPLEVRATGRSVEISGVKRRALLAVLALHANRPVSVERLAVALWGEDAPPGAVKAVQVSVSRLRRALGEDAVLETTPGGYRLVIDPGELDVECFESALTAGREALAAGDPRRAAARLCAALRLWRGEPLQEFIWAPFAAPEIQRLEELRLNALESRIDAELAVGLHGELVAELQRLVDEHSWRERLHGQLMVALYRAGRQAEALAAYRRARRVLVEQLGIEPGPELRELHQAMLAQDASLAAPSVGVLAPSARRGALPTPPNRTIGRAAEVRAVIERLRAGGVRLLTLTGPGGVGKTRLALEAAGAVAGDFADGAWFVSLAAIGRAPDVASAMLSVLGIVSLKGEAAQDAVERFLSPKHLLLVVDNCEHLPGAAAFIGRLPAAGPGITVLATSREPLAVQAEYVYPVAPLALPDAADLNLGGLAGVAAVALFCERAQAHDPDFELGVDSAGAVTEICRRLDGLPLAIELAAARCGLLSASEIAARLGVALAALGAGPRDAPARHHTLRATLDWSHELLDDGEKVCFARLAVFAGGATVEAAQGITGADLDTLERLVAKSLVVRRQRQGATRLMMLETVRAYAAERFAALADCEAVRERHFDHFLCVARRHGIDSALDGPDRAEHLACLDAEVQNFRAALQWAAERDATERVLALSATLIDYWMRRDQYAEAADWALSALRKRTTKSDPALRARALAKTLWPLRFLGRDDEVLGLLSEAELLAGAVPDLVIRAEVLYNCAAIKAFTGRPDEARATADEAFATAEASGDRWTIAMAAWARTAAADSDRELRERIDEAASRLAGVGNAYHLVTLYMNAVSSAWIRGSDAEAAKYLEPAVGLARCLGQRYLWLCVVSEIGLVALSSGDTKAADAAFREALELSHDLVLPGAAIVALAGLASVAAVDGEPEHAARLARAVAVNLGDLNEADIIGRLQATFLEPAGISSATDTALATAHSGAALSIQQATLCALEHPPVEIHRPTAGRQASASYAG